MSNGTDSEPPVKPGQIITADLMNRLLERVSDLEDRVSDLEERDPAAPTNVVISDHRPKQDLRVGDRLTLEGKNFAVPGERNQITVGGIAVPDVNILQGGSETNLQFVVPDVGGIQEAGTRVKVDLINSNGSAREEITLKPKLDVPTGTIEVSYAEAPVTVDDTTLQGGNSYVFTYRVTSSAQQGSYRASVTTSAGWNARIVSASGDGSTYDFSMTAGTDGSASREIRVAVDIPDQTSGTTDLTLEVEETTPQTQVTTGRNVQTLEIGADAPVPDDWVRISIETNSNLSQGRLEVPIGQTVRVTFNVRVFESGSYQLSTNLDAERNWNSALAFTGFDVQGDVGSGGNLTTVNATVTAESGSTDTDLVLTVSEGGRSANFVIPVRAVSG
jgi:hypothetical protein